jgi:hypothetical protein
VNPEETFRLTVLEPLTGFDPNSPAAEVAGNSCYSRRLVAAQENPNRPRKTEQNLSHTIFILPIQLFFNLI